MKSEIKNLLKDTFGLESFHPGQLEVIKALLAGHSSLAVFPTGGGKSLCYQLTALLQPGLTLVVSPLIALMKDQVDALQALGIEAARVDSTLDSSEFRQILEKIRQNQLKLLYIAPERLGNEKFVQTISHADISLLAIDEAHCISEWGHNFRPDYLKLAYHAKHLGIKKILALTATATPKVSENICDVFGIEKKDHIQTGFYRPNLSLHITPCEGNAKDRLLLERIEEKSQLPTIVYVTLQKTSERVAQMLSNKGINACAYHAGMKSDDRSQIQESFMKGETTVIVATIAFGMGIDKDNVRAIYHYNIPKSLENYVQEIGRAGRDGLPSHCEMFVNAEDCTTLLNFTYGDTPAAHTIKGVIEEVLGQENEFKFNAYEVSRKYDIRPLVLNTLMTYLELDRRIEHIGAVFETYQWRWNTDEDDVIAGFDKDRQLFLRKLLSAAKRGRIWDKIECEEVATQINEPRERIVKALGYFEEKGWIELKLTGVRQRYRVLNPARDASELIEKYVSRFENREKQDEIRMAQIVNLAEKPGCIVGSLLRYFGENFPDRCGHCNDCTGRKVGPVPGANNLLWKPFHDTIVDAGISEHSSRLKDSRAITRLLCGLTSPLLTSTKLSKSSEFGSLSNLPFKQVLAKVEERMEKSHEPEYFENRSDA